MAGRADLASIAGTLARVASALARVGGLFAGITGVVPGHARILGPGHDGDLHLQVVVGRPPCPGSLNHATPSSTTPKNSS